MKRRCQINFRTINTEIERNAQYGKTDNDKISS